MLCHHIPSPHSRPTEYCSSWIYSRASRRRVQSLQEPRLRRRCAPRAHSHSLAHCSQLLAPHSPLAPCFLLPAPHHSQVPGYHQSRHGCSPPVRSMASREASPEASAVPTASVSAAVAAPVLVLISVPILYELLYSKDLGIMGFIYSMDYYSKDSRIMGI